MINGLIFVFPGQGSQYVGMAKDLFNDFAVVRYTFEQISDLTHKNIAEICFDSSARELNKAENISLETLAHSVSIARIIEQEFNMPLYDIAYAMSGHSMGQYSALHCAGSIAFEDVVELLQARSTYMSSSSVGGGMVCLSGVTKQQVSKVLRVAKRVGIAEVSNHNSREQFVISADSNALNKIIEVAPSFGIRFVKCLNVSIPAHSVLMKDARRQMDENLKNVEITKPRVKWFSNQTSGIIKNPREIRRALSKQITHGVRWSDIMDKFPKYNITCAYELGPGHVLTRLINRANVGCEAKSIDGIKSVRGLLDELNKKLGRVR